MKFSSKVLLCLMALAFISAMTCLNFEYETGAILSLVVLDVLAVVFIIAEPSTTEHYVHDMYMFPFIP